MAQYEVMGDSYADDCNCYTVTDDELNQVGAAWNLNSIDLNEDFDMQFEVFLGCTPGGADGLAFVMASEGGQLGNNGSAMGVGGLDQSIALCFDTYVNSPYMDPAGDHLSLHANGHLIHDGSADDLADAVVVDNIEDCLWHDFQITWDVDNQLLEVYFDGNFILDYTGDIINDIYDGDSEVFWGFAGATGGASNEQKFCASTDVDVDVDIPLICSGSDFEVLDVSVSNWEILEWNWLVDGQAFAGVQQVDFMIESNGDYPLTLALTDVHGCVHNEDFTLAVVGPYSGENSAVEACPQDTAFNLFMGLEGAPDSGGYWEDDMGTAVSQVVDLSQTSGGTYWYTVTSDICPDVSSSLEVQLLSICNVLCTTDPFQFDVVDNLCMGGLQGEIHFSSPPAVGYSIDGGVSWQVSPDFVGLPSGDYDLAVDFGACIKTDFASITNPSQVEVAADEDVLICVDGEAELGAQASGGVGPYNYEWDNGIGQGQNVSDFPDEPTCYTVFAVDANGCESATDEMCVELLPELDLEIIEDQLLCPGDNLELWAAGSGGSGSGYNYLWTYNGEIIGQGSEELVDPVNNSTYCVEVTDNCSTPAVSACVDVEVPWLYPSIQASESTGCIPLEVGFSHDVAETDLLSSSWSFGDGSSESAITGLDHTYTEAGCFDLGLTVTSIYGCEYYSSELSLVCVDPDPVADFSFGPQPVSVSNPSISFFNSSEGAETYSWDFGPTTEPAFSDLVDDEALFPNTGPGFYPVTLTAISEYGCVDSVTYVVEIQGEQSMYVPNAFTPDGDGVNEVFGVQFPLPDEVVDYQIQIFNRWGEQLFLSNDIHEKWNGSVNQGEYFAPDGVYLWQVEYRMANHPEIVYFKGFVTLIR